ncbi:hypothetical protein SEA_WARPY_253 [Streptomyces phage Warpy]|uniref:Uncharacterized protein n=1 Tax=Streptomyces phage Warpy TaxID=2015805 RepID=A0A221SAQ1_9CAUD|nr:hypothetical protein SEA_WARPY_1 [Streptomyces phage Warpy]ASN73283.1 hypothetical protein SEA_WARPY_253 [Streptomyces phage Warpy]
MFRSGTNYLTSTFIALTSILPPNPRQIRLSGIDNYAPKRAKNEPKHAEIKGNAAILPIILPLSRNFNSHS